MGDASAKDLDYFLRAPDLFRSIFENSTAGIAVVALDGRYLMVNPAFCRIFGYTAEELLEVDFFELTHPDDQALSARVMREVLDGRGRQVHFSKRYFRRDGRTIWTEVSSALIYRPDGEPSHFITHLLDVTERKLAEMALDEERERLAVTLRSIGDGVITVDTAGQVEIVNDAAEALTGWTQHDALGQPIADVLAIFNEITGAPCENPVAKVLRSGHPVELENHTVLIARDGTRRIIADSGAPIRDSKGLVKGVVLVFRDITEKQRLIDSAQRAQRLESLGVLAGGIAHDFNNLLAGIYGNIELARLSETREEMADCLQNTLGTLERARGLTQQLLTFSKGGAPVPRTGNLDVFLRETVQFALSGSDASVAYDIPADLWCCDFDAGQLGQAIDNLVINAVQAMPNGGSITVTGTNLQVSEGRFPGLPAGRYVGITIRDTGIGMSPEVSSRIFDPFFTTKQLGNGLGLAIVHSIVGQHGGAIEVESRPGVGTAFHLVLPASAGHTVEIRAVPRKKSGGGRILVMDDDPALFAVRVDDRRAWLRGGLRGGRGGSADPVLGRKATRQGLPGRHSGLDRPRSDGWPGGSGPDQEGRSRGSDLCRQWVRQRRGNGGSCLPRACGQHPKTLHAWRAGRGAEPPGNDGSRHGTGLKAEALEVYQTKPEPTLSCIAATIWLWAMTWTWPF
jgi:PAS domain S-box-containing protein